MFILLGFRKCGEKMSQKHENFVRLAESRVDKALDAIRIIGNLTNRNYYEFSAEEAREITSALQVAVNDLKSQFARAEAAQSRGFKLQSSTRKEQ
jgi:hypothetical protein